MSIQHREQCMCRAMAPTHGSVSGNAALRGDF